MTIKKYQVRIRKDVTDSFKEKFTESMSALGLGTATEIQTLNGNFENLADAFEEMSKVKELEGYEVISIILVDSDNSDQLGDDFDWDGVA